MMVSVILASYNHIRFVKESVESVLSQSLTDLELIVLDDGSTDGTADEVDKIKDNRLKLVRLNPNRRYYPRSLGINMAKGKYLAFQNSDDVWVKDKLEKQIAVMENNRNVALCFTRMEIIDEMGKVLENTWAHGNLAGSNMSSKSWLRLLFGSAVNFGIASAIIRKDQVKKVHGFNESMVQMSNYDLWVRLLALGELVIIDEKLTKMRIVDGLNLSTPKNEVYWRSALENVDILNRYVQWPLNKHLKEIFSDIMPKDTNLFSVQMGMLIKYSWSLNTPQHSMFADRLMVQLLTDSKMSEEILTYFGADFKKEFLRRRGEIEIVIHNHNESV